MCPVQCVTHVSGRSSPVNTRLFSLSPFRGIFHNGTGQFTLPKGFEYDALASVECDAGKAIESRESRPDQRIKAADGSHSSRDDFCRFGTTMRALGRPLMNFGPTSRQSGVEVVTAGEIG